MERYESVGLVRLGVLRRCWLRKLSVRLCIPTRSLSLFYALLCLPKAQSPPPFAFWISEFRCLPRSPSHSVWRSTRYFELLLKPTLITPTRH